MLCGTTADCPGFETAAGKELNKSGKLLPQFLPGKTISEFGIMSPMLIKEMFEK